MLKIIRNNQEFGPYDYQALSTYVKSGQILLCDQAKDVSTGEVNSVRYFFRKNKIKVKVDKKGGLIDQLKNIGGELIIPKSVIASKQWISDKRDDWPQFITKTLEYFGDRAVMISDGLGFTGQDAVYDFDDPVPPMIPTVVPLGMVRFMFESTGVPCSV